MYGLGPLSAHEVATLGIKEAPPDAQPALVSAAHAFGLAAEARVPKEPQ